MFLVHHWEVMITYLQETIDSITRATISGFFSNSIYDVIILDRESYKVQEKESSQDSSIKEDDKQVKPGATIVK